MESLLLSLIALNPTNTKEKPAEQTSSQCVEKTKQIRIVEKYGSWADFREKIVYGIHKMLYSVRYQSGRTDRTEYTYDSDGRLKNWRGKSVGDTYLEWEKTSRATRGMLNLFEGPDAIGTVTVPFTRTYGKSIEDSVTKYDLREIDVNIFPQKKVPKIFEMRFDEQFGVTAIFTKYTDNSRKTRILQILSRAHLCH